MALVVFYWINRRNVIIFILKTKILFEIFLWLQLEVSVLCEIIVLKFAAIVNSFLWLRFLSVIEDLGIGSLWVFGVSLRLSSISVRGRILFASLLFQKIFVKIVLGWGRRIVFLVGFAGSTGGVAQES